MTTETDQNLTAKQIADLLGIRFTTVNSWVLTGQLTAVGETASHRGRWIKVGLYSLAQARQVADTVFASNAWASAHRGKQ